MSRVQRVLVALAASIALAIGGAAPAALASSGDQYFSRLTCSGLQAVQIYSTGGENWLTYTWDSGSHNHWNPYGYYYGYQTGDTSTWAVISWDHLQPSSMGRSCYPIT